MADDTSSSMVFRQQLSSNDLAEVEEFLCVNYADVTLRHTGDATRFAWEHDLVGTGGFTVSRMRTSWAYGAQLDGMNGQIAVASVRAGGVRVARNSYGELRAGPGDTVLTPPVGDVAWVADPSDVELVALDGVGVAAYAAHACGGSVEDFRVTGLSPVSAALARYWNAAVAHVRDGVLDNPDAAGSPILIDNAFRMLAAALLSTFPNTARAAVTGPGARGVRGDVSAATLRSVVDYLDAHSHRPVGPADLAEVGGRPAREVVAGLRRRRDTSPAELLWRARLVGVRRDLRAADPLRETVAVVAARWGFDHAGRFRIAYAKAFDEQPEDTLRR